MVNVLCVSYMDNGGAMQQLTNALNKYTGHSARHINYKQTWLGYDTDIRAAEHTTDELKEMLKDRNFFIFSEVIPPEFQCLGFNINRTNMITRCCGTSVRTNLDRYRNWWINDFTTFSGGGFDPTIHPHIGFYSYHVSNVYDFSKFPEQDQDIPITICHAPTGKKEKSTDKVISVLNRLRKEFDFKISIADNITWKESLELKSRGHITIDQFMIGGYGNSAIESMFYGHAVIGRISPFIRSIHPDLPIVQATEDTLEDVLREILSNPDKLRLIGQASHRFAVNEYSAAINIKKWDHLIKWVIEGFR